MKKNLLIAVAILFTGEFVNAQTQKGTKNLGVYADYLHNNATNVSTPTPFSPSLQKSSYTNFSFGPNYGYFVADGTELAATAFVTGGTQTTEGVYPATTNINKQKSNTFGVTVFLRKYFLYDNKFGFRVGPYAGYSFGKTKYESTPPNAYNGTSSDYNGYNVGALLDLVYYPSSKLGIAANLASLNYSHSKTKGIDETTNNNFNTRFANQGLTLSVFYVLGAKQ